MKRALLTAGIVSAVGLMTVAGATAAYAVTDTSAGSDPMSSLVTTLAEKFNLNKEEVQQVFDEQRDAMEVEREQQIKDELAQAVEDGKLTQDQVDKIIAKRAELKEARDAADQSDKTLSERRSVMEAERTELEEWAEDNDISSEYLRYAFGKGGHHGHGPGDFGSRGDDDTASPGSSSSN